MDRDLKERVTVARAKYEQLHDSWLSGSLLPRQATEMEWLDKEIQLIQAEALVRLSFRAWG